MNDEVFLDKLRDLNHGNVEDDAAIDPAAWDSIDVLDLISAIDVAFSVTIPIDKLNQCKTVGELRALIRNAA